MEYVQALFDYKGERHDELSFKQGDSIVVISKQFVDGWWVGRVKATEKLGVFPANFVQSNCPVPRDNHPAKELNPIDYTMNPLAKMMPEEKQDHPDACNMYMQAQCDYTAERPDELSFKEGDLVVVICKDFCPGWWIGRLKATHKLGLFPSNFVQANGLSQNRCSTDPSPIPIKRDPKVLNLMDYVGSNPLASVTPEELEDSNNNSNSNKIKPTKSVTPTSTTSTTTATNVDDMVDKLNSDLKGLFLNFYNNFDIFKTHISNINKSNNKRQTLLDNLAQDTISRFAKQEEINEQMFNDLDMLRHSLARNN